MAIRDANQLNNLIALSKMDEAARGGLNAEGTAFSNPLLNEALEYYFQLWDFKPPSWEANDGQVGRLDTDAHLGVPIPSMSEWFEKLQGWLSNFPMWHHGYRYLGAVPFTPYSAPRSHFVLLRLAHQEETEPILSADDGRLSPVRKRVLELLNDLLPSEANPSSGAHKGLFKLRGWDHQSQVGTSCGWLPAAILKSFNVIHKMANWGATVGLRAGAIQQGVWIHATGHNLPMPGDLYCLRHQDEPNNPASVAHVGVVQSLPDNAISEGAIWTTADAGQGPTRESQKAEMGIQRQLAYVQHGNSSFPYLTGTRSTAGDYAGKRRLSGWVDIDRAAVMVGLPNVQPMTRALRKFCAGGGAKFSSQRCPSTRSNAPDIAARARSLELNDFQNWNPQPVMYDNPYRGPDCRPLNEEDIRHLNRACELLRLDTAHAKAVLVAKSFSTVPDHSGNSCFCSLLGTEFDPKNDSEVMAMLECVAQDYDAVALKLLMNSSSSESSSDEQSDPGVQLFASRELTDASLRLRHDSLMVNASGYGFLLNAAHLKKEGWDHTLPGNLWPKAAQGSPEHQRYESLVQLITETNPEQTASNREAEVGGNTTPSPLGSAQYTSPARALIQTYAKAWFSKTFPDLQMPRNLAELMGTIGKSAFNQEIWSAVPGLKEKDRNWVDGCVTLYALPSALQKDGLRLLEPPSPTKKTSSGNQAGTGRSEKPSPSSQLALLGNWLCATPPEDSPRVLMPTTGEAIALEPGDLALLLTPNGRPGGNPVTVVRHTGTTLIMLSCVGQGGAGCVRFEQIELAPIPEGMKFRKILREALTKSQKKEVSKDVISHFLRRLQVHWPKDKKGIPELDEEKLKSPSNPSSPRAEDYAMWAAWCYQDTKMLRYFEDSLTQLQDELPELGTAWLVGVAKTSGIMSRTIDKSMSDDELMANGLGRM